MSWRNLQDARFEINFKPDKKLSFDIRYHAFWLADRHDYWFRSNGYSTLRTTTPDGVMFQTGPHSDANFGYVMTTFTF